jgi:hypothetical protein
LNGYSRVQIEKLAIKHSNQQRISQITTLTPLEEAQMYVTILYFSRYNKVVNIFNKQRVRNKLRSPKDATPILEKSGIYELTCETCNAVSVGQTRRTVIKRLKEHLACVRRNPERSSVAPHIGDNMCKNSQSYYRKINLAAILENGASKNLLLTKL